MNQTELVPVPGRLELISIPELKCVADIASRKRRNYSRYPTIFKPNNFEIAQIVLK